MSLIICPHCGRKVSDTVNTCIHCQGLLSQNATQQQSLQEFNQFPKQQQQQLRKNFQKLYPKANSFIKNEKRAKKLCVLFIALGFAFYIAEIATLLGIYLLTDWMAVKEHTITFNNGQTITYTSDSMPTGAIIFICLTLLMCIICFICSIIFLRRKKKLHKRSLIAEKAFQYYLKQQEIQYKPIFSTIKEEQIFNNIDLDIINLK